MWVNIVVCAAFIAQTALHLAHRASLRAKLRGKEGEVAALAQERRDERLGRTKAERALRELQMRVGQQQGGTLAGEQPSLAAKDLLQVPFPMRPVGVLRSCFSRRNGTPRQPLLVPAARAVLTLRPHLGPAFFDGLAAFSHCWVLYVFHENTDLQRLWSDDSSGVRAKIRVPRLNGKRLGLFATRSPHRPCPIGLSVAEIISVDGNTLTLGGADIVDGSPVLDIKPYVPFCDAVPQASAPAWVAPAAEDEPLAIDAVHLPPAADEALRQSWQRHGSRSLYPSYDSFRELVLQVLSRDIRSVAQRVTVAARAQQDGTLPALQEAIPAGPAEDGRWHVVLDGCDITYDVDDQSRVTIKSATLLPP